MATHVALMTIGLDADTQKEAEAFAATIADRLDREEMGVTFATVDAVHEADK